MMHSTADNHTLSPDLWRRHSLKLSILVLLFSVAPVLLLISNRTIPALACLAIPLAIFFISSPKYGFYLFVALNFIYSPYLISGFAVHPWDIAAFLFLTAVSISWLFKYSSKVDRTVFDYGLIALILATLLSATFAYKPSLSIIPTARIILLYLVFRALYSYSGKMDASRMLRYFILILTLFSLYNCYHFFILGGGLRIFGLSGIAFETFCMIGVPVSLAYAIWSSRRKSRVYYSILFLINLTASVATVSRGLLLTLAIAIPVLLFVSYKKAKKTNCRHARNYVRGLIMVVIPILVVVIAGSGYFLLVGERFEELGAGQPTGTILLRLSLWKAALDTFMLDPITGIGAGNFRVIDELLRGLKFDPVRYYLIGTSFHNVFLQYLAETGLPGGLAILFLGWHVFRIGRRTINLSNKESDMPLVTALYISSFIFFITIFYMRAWTWGQEGYMLALILALLARAYRPFQISGEE